ncbi:MAG: hypothetical protein HY097_09485 [Nitrospinae bacterium]|nr:hypothetical protein [Nitrospinota bacterium]MBI3814095.1 hypothetical protein [Nitrospinota bacterium]
MKKILQIDGKSKVRKARAVEVKGLKEYGALEFEDGNRSGYLFSHYSKANRETAGILVHWEY